jgi:hypothetical protein
MSVVLQFDGDERVGFVAQCLFESLFSAFESSNVVSLELFPDARLLRVEVLPSREDTLLVEELKLSDSAVNDFTLLRTGLRPEFSVGSERSRAVAFLMADAAVEQWLKFGRRKFYAEVGTVGSDSFLLRADGGCSAGELGALLSDELEGYAVDGSFWGRDWLHRKPANSVVGGGKL